MAGLETLLQTYGYYALFLGTFLEGETVLVLAGFLAHQGYLELRWVIFLAFLGSMTGDQLCFFLGRKKGRDWLARHPRWDKRAARVHRALERYQAYVVLSFRFFYGLRNITPFVIGSSGFSPTRFLLLNATGALIWAVVVGSAGYIFGEAIRLFLADVKKYERLLLAVVALAGCVLWFIHSRMLRKRVAAEAEQVRLDKAATTAQPERRAPQRVEVEPVEEQANR